MNNFIIQESASGVFTLKVWGRYVCRRFSYEEALEAYEEYLLIQEAKKQKRRAKS